MSRQFSLKIEIKEIKQGAIWTVKRMIFIVPALLVSFPALKYFFPCMEGACRHIRNFFAGFLGISVVHLAAYLLSKKKPPQ